MKQAIGETAETIGEARKRSILSVPAIHHSQTIPSTEKARKATYIDVVRWPNRLEPWRANKRDTVTTSSTEAELLALPQTAKEAIFIRRLFKAMTLKLNGPLYIDCESATTRRHSG
jgi:hypothetical protein